MTKFTIDFTALDGIVVLAPQVWKDHRGHFLECFNAREFAEIGLPTEFVQDNVSRSRCGVLRGLHFQWDPPMGKLLQVLSGRVQLVELDIRPLSPHCGKHITLELSDEAPRLVWIPPGFANGFLVLSEQAVVHYKCTAFYNPNGEGAIRWNDPAIDIAWAWESTPIVSERDATAPTLAEWLSSPHASVFVFPNA